MHCPELFETVTIGPLTLKNRFVMAPMSIHMTDDGSVTAQEVAFYRRRAQGGVAMIIVGSICIRPDGDFGGQIYIDSDECIDGLRRLTDAIHDHDCLVSAQIHHSGRETSIEQTGYQPVAPSYFEPEEYSIFRAEYSPPRALRTEEVSDYVEAYAQGIRRAKLAGFDAVELHGAHGYLICAFMSPLTNKRTDRYGGSFLGRMRFVTEIIERSRDLVGADFPITIRIVGDECRAGGIDPHLSVRIACHLEKLGVAAISVSAGMYPYIRTVPNTYHERGVNLHLAEKVRDAVSVPIIAAGRLSDPEIQIEAIRRKKADLIGLGRTLIADPDYPTKLASGKIADIIPCIACNKGCHDRTAGDRSVKCMLNVNAGREYDPAYDLARATKSEKILIVGAGPAGMEAARVAALRGHEVTLCEAADDIGGKIIQAALAPGKESYMEVLRYYRTQLKKLNVETKTKTRVDSSYIKNSHYHSVVIATGALETKSRIAGLEPHQALTATQAFLHPEQVGKRVAIVGGGAVGSELAHYLMSVREVTVYLVESKIHIAHGMPQDSTICLLDELALDTNLHVVPSARAVRYDGGDLYYKKEGAELKIEQIDTVILSVGPHGTDEFDDVRSLPSPRVKIIGDAEQPDDMVKAIRQGYEAAAWL
jgi:2,4-dienoyl-CoA reductase-like NADH-dependent reductase (Old Yellow Enzyme family)/thioredoxin reductase